MSPMVCSAADTMFDVGALQTMTPASEAHSTSMLSTVTPARPMIFKLEAASMTALSTLVAERTMSAS